MNIKIFRLVLNQRFNINIPTVKSQILSTFGFCGVLVNYLSGVKGALEFRFT